MEWPFTTTFSATLDLVQEYLLNPKCGYGVSPASLKSSGLWHLNASLYSDISFGSVFHLLATKEHRWKEPNRQKPGSTPWMMEARLWRTQSSIPPQVVSAEPIGIHSLCEPLKWPNQRITRSATERSTFRFPQTNRTNPLTSKTSQYCCS